MNFGIGSSEGRSISPQNVTAISSKATWIPRKSYYFIEGMIPRMPFASSGKLSRG